MNSLQRIKEEIDRVNIEIQAAERDYDLNRAAELKYGTLLQLQKNLTEAEKSLETQVRSDDDFMTPVSGDCQVFPNNDCQCI